MSIDNNNSSTSAQQVQCIYLSKYEKWYWSLINKVVVRQLKGSEPGHFETHHPIPKCLWLSKDGSEYDRYWEVLVTPREHWVLHMLLTKMQIHPFLGAALQRFTKAVRDYKYTNLDWLVPLMRRKYTANGKGYKHLASVKQKEKQLFRSMARNKKLYGIKPWNNNKATIANIEFWKHADYLIYVIGLLNLKTPWELSKAENVSYVQSRNLFKAIEGKLSSLCPDGEPWNPENDVSWKEFALDDIV